VATSRAQLQPVEPSAAPRTSRGLRTLAALMQAAREEFEEKGFGATGVLGITRRAGLSNAAFYFYFPGKEAIFLALIDEVLGTMVADSRASLVQEHLASKLPFEEALRRATSRYLDLYLENARFMRVVDEASSLSGDVRAVMRERWRHELEVSTDLTIEAQRAGFVDPDIDALSVSAVLSAMVQQTAHLLGLGGLHADRDAAEDAIILVTTRALRIRRTPRKPGKAVPAEERPAEERPAEERPAEAARGRAAPAAPRGRSARTRG
jgi:AcrR family transcriptional regulator